jgi:hypothetical protein
MLLCLYVLWISTGHATGQPGIGDIVIIGLQADGTDRFAWVPLIDLEAGQEIYFTDAGWNGEEGKFQRQINETADPTTTSPSGGAIRFIAPQSGISAGTVIEVRIDSRTVGEPGAYALTVTGADAGRFVASNDEDVFGDQGISISTSGDQLIVFTGPIHSPMFIYGVNTGAAVWDRGSTSAQHASDIPDGLTDGISAVAIGIGPQSGDEVDNGKYSGPVSGTRSAILTSVSNRNNWETSDSPFDDITPGVSGFVIANDSIPTMAPDTTVFIEIDTSFVEPGQETQVEVWINNTSGIDLGPITFQIQKENAPHLAFIDLVLDQSRTGVTAASVYGGKGSTILIEITGSNGHTMPPGRHRLGALRFRADTEFETSILGSISRISIVEESLDVLDSEGILVGAQRLDGVVFTGIRGDINKDGMRNIMDVIICVRLILGIEGLAPEPGGPEYAISDANNDGLLNISDAVAVVNHILGIPSAQSRPMPNRLARLRIGRIEYSMSKNPCIPIYLDYAGAVAGIQVVLRSQNTNLKASTPVAIQWQDHVVESAVAGDLLSIVALNLTNSDHARDTTAPLLTIPTGTNPSSGTQSLRLESATVLDRFGNHLPVSLEQSYSSGHEGATSDHHKWRLLPNVPNPFNPATTIDYLVPVSDKVTLRIYNILGQEVAKLADGHHEPGLYTVSWNGRSSTGEEMPGGVYLYRVTGHSGFTQTRRMTLLK